MGGLGKGRGGVVGVGGGLARKKGGIGSSVMWLKGNFCQVVALGNFGRKGDAQLLKNV